MCDFRDLSTYFSRFLELQFQSSRLGDDLKEVGMCTHNSKIEITSRMNNFFFLITILESCVMNKMNNYAEYSWQLIFRGFYEYEISLFLLNMVAKSSVTKKA